MWTENKGTGRWGVEVKEKRFIQKLSYVTMKLKKDDQARGEKRIEHIQSGRESRETEESSSSQCLSMSLQFCLGTFSKINFRNYHSASVPSLGFYNFIFLLQCLYPRAPQFISAAQPRWIINRGREQKDDEWHKRSIIHTQLRTFLGGNMLWNLSAFFT